MKDKVSVFWFRRDLRLEDNIGLFHALNSGVPILPIFIFDKNILEHFDDKCDKRVDYIHQVLTLINEDLNNIGSSLTTYYSSPLQVFNDIIDKYDLQTVYCNRDYEPAAIKRDIQVYDFLSNQNISFKGYKDQVIFDRNDILKSDGKPYTVYTPYSKIWKAKLNKECYQYYKIDNSKFYKLPPKPIHSLAELGFEKTDIVFEIPSLNEKLISEYDKYRDYPAMKKTTELGIALRFGTVSVRHCVSVAIDLNQTWLNELIWREFFMQILYHFPKVIDSSFKAKYDNIIWRNDEREFELWCQGRTGYPIVDAGMRQLNETGFMHNRVRMVVASFLCKHLLIDWRWGEAYFAQKLNDYDLAANNGNWQWAAGSGCDAAPYFRVFNPTIQTQKFDKSFEYIKEWLPDYGTVDYPQPIVEHSFARDRALKTYAEAVSNTI